MTNIPFVPASDLKKLWRALIEFNMLKEGDKVLIGLSGGKDSMFLTAALSEIKKYAPFNFELAAYTVDTMFSKEFPQKELTAFTDSFNLKHYHEQVNVMEAWQNRGNTPCFTCAYFRRAATNRKAKELGFNIVALAHHKDDAVETFLLNLLTSGQLKTFLPVTYLTRSDITVLRPLLYYREKEIIEIAKRINLHPLKNPCPYDGHTKRQEIKELIEKLSAINPEIFEHLTSAMRLTPNIELWPQALEQKNMVEKFRSFWKKNNYM